jgi:hypothetical protein
MSFLPASVKVPEFKKIGNAPKIEIAVDSPKHLFYIARQFSIEDGYTNLISKLQFQVLDSQGNKVVTESDEDFFYTGDVDGANMSAGSVFHLSDNINYPFKGYLVSNIGSFDDVVWIQSSGSFVLAISILVTLLIISALIVYWRLIGK